MNHFDYRVRTWWPCINFWGCLQFWYSIIGDDDRKRPTDSMFKDGVDIINFVEGNFPQQIFQVIDDHLMEECKDFPQAKQEAENAVYQCLVSVLEVAISCTRPLPNERMNMKQIASKMHAIKTSYDVWKTKKHSSLE